MPAPTPVGSEILVNMATTGTQSDPSAALLAGGHYVVTWTDGTEKIFARILDSDGTPLAGDIQVSLESSAGNPSIVALAGGGFLIGWNDGTGVGGLDIRAQIFDGSGTRVGGEFVVNTTLAGAQSDADFTRLADGRILASWTDFDGSADSIKAQLFAADGTRIGSEFQASPLGTNATSAMVAALSGGGFAVAYTSSSDGGAHQNVSVQVFDSIGHPSGSPVPIAFDAAGHHYDPVIAALPDDGFVVTWKNASHPGASDNLIEIDAQPFAAGGAAVTGAFAVNAHPTIFDPQGLTVQSFADGRFLIVWPDHSGTIGDSDDGGIVGQLYDPAGTPIGAEFLIDSQTVNGQFDGTITADANGNFLVAWTDQGASLSVDIKAQELALSQRPLFDNAANHVDFNLVHPADFAGPYNNAGGGSDVVQLPDSSGDLAIWGLANGFSGGAGNDMLTEGAAFVPLFGGGGDDILAGNSGHDVLVGGDGNDVLNGFGGGDELIGGDGNDLYVIGSASDTIVEQSGGGVDTAQTSLSFYALRDNVENLTFTGTGTFSGSGNALDNVITGGTGAASELIGGDGNDTYVVSVAGDTLVEGAAGGIDTVRTGLSFYGLRDNIENLTFVGSGHFTGIGNGGDNVITGGTGAASELDGAGGNDTYVISVAGDTIIEQAGGGIDTVQTALSVYQLTAAQVENLTYTGTGHFTGIGNALDNVITGGAQSDDYLYAGAGADTLIGGGGADLFLFDQPVDGIDTIADFVSGSDRIFLNGTVFAHGASFNLVQGAGTLTATDGASTFFYHSDTGQIGYDADGTGAGAEIIFAAIGAGKVLVPADFHFY